MSMYNKRKITSKKIPLTLSAIVLFLIIGGGVFAYANSLWPFPSKKTTESTETRGTNSIDYSGITEQEEAASQDAKKRETEQSEATNSTSSKKSVGVAISYADINDAGKVEIRGFANGVVEGTGTCTATLSKKGASTITLSSVAFVDVSTSICEPIYLDSSKLSAGTWNIKIDYSSPDAIGTSDIATVEIK